MSVKVEYSSDGGLTWATFGGDPWPFLNAWQANTAYALDDDVRPTAANGYAYRCISAGTSNSSEPPKWPTAPGKTIADNTVVWACIGRTSGDAGIHIVRLALKEVYARSIMVKITTAEALTWGVRAVLLKGRPRLQEMSLQ